MNRWVWGFIFMFAGAVLVWVGYNNTPWTFSSYALMGVGALLDIAGIVKLMGSAKYERKLGLGSSNLLAVLLVALIAIGLGVAFATHRLSITGVKLPQATTSTPSEEKIALNLPIKFVFYNTINNSVVNPTSVAIYDSSGHLLESLTPSGGSAITTFSYKSGTQLLLKITENSTFYFVPVAVPYYDKDVALITRPSEHQIRVPCTVVPSALSIRVYDNLGNAIASGSTVSVTSATSYTITVVNSEPNTALPEPFTNIITGSKYGNYLLIEIMGTTSAVPSVSGATLVGRGDGWAVYEIPLNTLTAKTDPRTGALIPGTQSIAITVDPAGLVGNYTIHIVAGTDIDINYFQSTSGTALNTDAVKLATFDFTIQT